MTQTITQRGNSKSINWLTATLWLVVVVSALTVVNIRYSCRALYTELARLESDFNHQQVVWGQLLLGQAAHGSFSRVEQQASDRLGMRAPAAEDIVVVRP